MHNIKNSFSHGRIKPHTLVIIGLIVLFIGAGSFGIWAFLQYQDQKTDVDGKISVAVLEAKGEQAAEDQKYFDERDKEPNRQFVGPSDYGRVTFDYDKRWSVYEASDVGGGSGDYEAYFHPLVVQQIKSDNRYALRVTIENASYEDVLKDYEGEVEDGELKSSPVSADGEQGTRFDGQFDKNIRGAAVVFKIRDKTLTIQTDADTFKPDFNKLVKTIEFNK